MIYIHIYYIYIYIYIFMYVYMYMYIYIRYCTYPTFVIQHFILYGGENLQMMAVLNPRRYFKPNLDTSECFSGHHLVTYTINTKVLICNVHLPVSDAKRSFMHNAEFNAIVVFNVLYFPPLLNGNSLSYHFLCSRGPNY